MNRFFILALVALAIVRPELRLAEQSQNTVSITEEEARGHRQGRQLILRVKPITSEINQLVADGSRVLVTVDSAGTVISAVADQNLPPNLRAQAEAAALQLKYRPFERNGHPIWVNFEEPVFVLPPELEPSQHVPFPTVHNWVTVRITLSRSGCLGSCPIYRIEVNGDGTVQYDGKGYVAISGQHEAVVPKENVRELVSRFRNADFYSMRDEYVWPFTDQPTYETSIEIDGKLKRVKDYAGLKIGMPMVISELEDAIDRLTNAEQWTNSDNAPFKEPRE